MLLPTERLLTVSEAASLTRVSTDSVRRWCRLGLLPAFKAGERGHYRVRIEDLRAFIAGPKHD